MNSPTSVLVWSAVPTPLTADLKVDMGSVSRMLDAAAADQVDGLFVAGTCGEGPWLPDRERRRLFKAVVRAAAGRMKIAAQVSDNSVSRILDNIAMAADAGADYAIIAPPATMLNATGDRIVGLYGESAAASPLPVGIYDLGRRRPHPIPAERLKEVYLLANVQVVKDSSGSPERQAIALAARAEKPTLRLFNGDEFRCLDYLRAGYDGFMFGGAVAVAPQMRSIAKLFLAGKLEEAAAVDAEMRRSLFGIYGGENIACWLSGLKYYMVCRRLFSTGASFLGYPLTESCREFVERYVTEQSVLADQHVVRSNGGNRSAPALAKRRAPVA